VLFSDADSHFDRITLVARTVESEGYLLKHTRLAREIRSDYAGDQCAKQLPLNYPSPEAVVPREVRINVERTVITG